jgi:AcrR family transcriptional regulator
MEDHAVCESVDPRVRRTRQLLQQALDKLLQMKDFENISVQDIAEAATVNRATFYDHFADKFALLEYSVAASFYGLIADRNVQFDSSCSSTLEGIILGVCNYLDSLPRAECERRKQMEPYLESAVIGVVRRTILKGMKEHTSSLATSPEMIATTLSWAIYGAAREWLHTPNHCPADEIVSTIMTMIAPIVATVRPASGQAVVS